MRIVIAPDSFKGSLTANEVCSAIRRGINAVDKQITVIEAPVADGGEGTVHALVYATKGKLIDVNVSDPLGRPILAQYGVLGDGETVVIEMAMASGLPLLKPHERNPMLTTSYGTGELIMHAVRAGYRKFIIGLGGSATNDGGAGMLSALGVRLLDKQGKPLPAGGGALIDLAEIDLNSLYPELRQCHFELATDVKNPLCGINGASAVYGPQKGATSEMISQLDAALAHYGKQLEQTTCRAVCNMPGSGAAGGMGAAFMAVFGAQSKAGIDVVLKAINFERLLLDADLVITGEGSLDAQTLSGKVIAGVCGCAAAHNVPVIALCGSLKLSSEEISKLGLQAAFSMLPEPCSLEEAIENADRWLQQQTEQMIQLLRLTKCCE